MKKIQEDLYRKTQEFQRRYNKERDDMNEKGKATLTYADGKTVECATLWTLYQTHLKDYDLDTVAEITRSPKELIRRLADDIATIKPAAIHVGEGVNHWFHATEANRAMYLPMMLTGNIGRPGAGVSTWAGNYKSALFQETHWIGPGFNGWIYEDPFDQNLDPAASGKKVAVAKHAKGEEPAYWNHGDRPLVVSYASSPPAEVLFGSDPEPEQAPTGVSTGTCFRQIEFAGLLAGAKNPEGGRALIDFLLSEEFQADVPLQMFVHPARGNVALPEVFTRYGVEIDEPGTLDPETITANRSQWVADWTTLVVR
jgi:hypothetical protein